MKKNKPVKIRNPKSEIRNKQKPVVSKAEPSAIANRKSVIRSPVRSGTKSAIQNQSLTKIGDQKSQIISSPWQLRPSDGQGVFTKYFSSYIPRKVEGDFYEFLREAIPVIDAAFGRLVSLDGHVIVKGDSDSHVDEIQDWIDNVAVNDIQKGMQAFHQNLSNEAFEQGFGMGEYVTDKKRMDIIGLRVADSKFIKFKRTAAGLDIYQKANDDIDYRLLNPANLMYFSINNENQNPYGTPLMRSCEFVAKILATIQNSLLNVWERFGDPSFSIIYKTSKKDGADLAARRQTIETEFNTAIKAKREGKSADFIRAIDTNSDITIKVIGADNQVLELEVPARHVLEQIIAKTGLPPWMLGMHWSTTERLSNAEAEMLLADVATRQSAKMPLFFNLVKTMLLLRGRTWKKGDWWLEWGQVNLHDTVQQAQARFLNAQADMYYLQNADKAGIQINRTDLAIGKANITAKAQRTQRKTNNLVGTGLKPALVLEPCACGCKHDHLTPAFRLGIDGQKELNRPTPWPELDKVESEYESRLKSDWAELQKTVFEILKFADVKSLAENSPLGRGVGVGNSAICNPQSKIEGIPAIEAFTFSDEQRALIMDALKQFTGIYDWREEDSPVRWYYGQSYSLGLIQAAKMIGKDQPILNIIKNQEIFEELIKTGFDFVKDNATMRMSGSIMAEMEAQMLAGTNPTHVAARLKAKFGEANSDWERLARSEMSMAAENAKVDEWGAWGINVEDAVIPVQDTHPRCKCSNSMREIDGEWKIVFTPAPDACPICLALAQ